MPIFAKQRGDAYLYHFQQPLPFLPQNPKVSIESMIYVYSYKDFWKSGQKR